MAQASYGERLDVVIRDEQSGQLKEIYFARSWNKLDDGTYEAIQPCVEMRQPNGQRVYIHADRGIAKVEAITGGGQNIRGGQMIGGVRIYLDRATKGDRPTFADMTPEDNPAEVFEKLDERREDMIRIWADELTFSMDPPEIYTPGRVTVWSAEADLVGEGLSLRWDEEPRELRTLRIERGQMIAIYSVPEDVNLLGMPGSEEAASAPAEAADAAPAEPPPPPAEAPTDETEIASATQPTPQPVDLDATVAAAPTGAVTPEPVATTAPAMATAEMTPVKNIYLAEFHDQVHVDSGGRQMRGADMLSLQFEWGKKARKGLRDRRPPTAARKDAGQPPSGDEAPPEDAAEPPSGDETPPEDAAQPPSGDEAPPEDAAQPSSGDEPPPSDSPKDPIDPVVVTWRGPLIFRPIGYTPTPSDRKYIVKATGNKIHLIDGEAEVTCRELVFHLPQQQGELTGAPGDPTRMLMGSEQEIVCAKIRFDVPAGKVFLTGPGRISQAPDLTTTTRPAEDEADPTAQLDEAGSIIWGGRMEANIGEQERIDADGKKTKQQYIEDAVFFGDVVLSQGPSDAGEASGRASDASADQPGGDFVQCDVLKVWMKAQPDGKIIPEVAVAKGNVSGRQAGSDIEAGEVRVFFDYVETLTAEGLVEKHLKPSIVQAEHDVRIIDHRNDQTIEATADLVESDLRDKTAVLYGRKKHAVIRQDQNTLAGDLIRLDQNRQSAVVEGPGRMQFEIESDMDGNELADPRPVDITWDEGMEYYGKTNAAVFTGNVHLISQFESMDCQQMRLLFEKDESAAPDAEATSQPAEVASGPEEDVESGREMGLNLEHYSRRKLATITAHGDVVLRSREEDDDGKLMRRLRLTGEQLFYDVRVNKLTMVRAGSMIVEDYRPADQVAASDSETPTQRPNQTGFRWTRIMVLDQESRSVELQGDVRMVHRSGKEVLRLAGIDAPEWDRLIEGRRTLLHCQRLDAAFGPPDEDDAAEAATTRRADKYDVGPRLGPLEIFIATGDVNLSDRLEGGTMQVLGQRLRYNRLDGTVVVWGFKETSPIADAMLVYESQGKHSTFSNPAMIFTLDGMRVKQVRLLDDVYATGTQ
ncbi:MAG TPA: hypothetical protein ENH89_10950 [Aurantimonas coralicida]|uniref:Organic solvent tolerance-like N-terminal domain-containing protein n=1 Tax=Aurantimonas coralicida TaxID=182270 RepID=A0A9C9NFY8_9HYPH|nr:hypothetical protein [Aurantimonas coralicida]